MNGKLGRFTKRAFALLLLCVLLCAQAALALAEGETAAPTETTVETATPTVEPAATETPTEPPATETTAPTPTIGETVSPTTTRLPYLRIPPRRGNRRHPRLRIPPRPVIFPTAPT